MSEIHCKQCDSVSCVRNGLMAGKQRYRCKDCGYNFTQTKPRGKHPGLKALAVLLYGLAGVTMAKIARITGVSEVAVYKWVKAAGLAASRPEGENAEIVMIDEMWHYVNGKKTKFGSGRPMTLYGVKSLPGIWVAVTTEALSNSSPRQAEQGRDGVS